MRPIKIKIKIMSTSIMGALTGVAAARAGENQRLPLVGSWVICTHYDSR